jgi:transposase-like protein
MKRYQKQRTEATEKISVPQMSLDSLVLEGARRLIQQALEEELTAVLGREHYEHHEPTESKHYRNGYGRERKVTIASGTLPLRVPRLREPYESHIVKRYQRMSEQMQGLVPQLYLHGLATGDFRQCFDAVVGPEAPLSGSSILRLKQTWSQEYDAWRKQRLDREYLYVWADGVYPKAGPKNQEMAVLVVVGLNRKGRKEILALEEGYRESAESWKDLLRSLKRRGVEWIGLTIADGSLGLWSALRDIFPHSRRQRCFVHKMRNILDKVPAAKQEEIRQALRSMYEASSVQEARQLVASFRAAYGKLYRKAVASLEEALSELFTYMAFPREHWRSIKSTNVIESMFASVKLRTDAAKRIASRESALYLIFKLLKALEQRTRKVNGCHLVAEAIDSLRNQKRQPRLRMVA